MVLLDINEERLNDICRTINGNSDVKHQAISFPCDITNIEQIRKICDVIRTEVGHPTMLINNAGNVVWNNVLQWNLYNVVSTSITFKKR